MTKKSIGKKFSDYLGPSYYNSITYKKNLYSPQLGIFRTTCIKQ